MTIKKTTRIDQTSSLSKQFEPIQSKSSWLKPGQKIPQNIRSKGSAGSMISFWHHGRHSKAALKLRLTGVSEEQNQDQTDPPKPHSAAQKRETCIQHPDKREGASWTAGLSEHGDTWRLDIASTALHQKRLITLYSPRDAPGRSARNTMIVTVDTRGHQ